MGSHIVMISQQLCMRTQVCSRHVVLQSNPSVYCNVAPQASELQALQEQFDRQVALAKQAEDNAHAAETKAAEQATIAAAARAEVCLGRAEHYVSALVASDMNGLHQASISTSCWMDCFQNACGRGYGSLF